MQFLFGTRLKFWRLQIFPDSHEAQQRDTDKTVISNTATMGEQAKDENGGLEMTAEDTAEGVRVDNTRRRMEEQESESLQDAWNTEGTMAKSIQITAQRKTKHAHSCSKSLHY